MRHKKLIIAIAAIVVTAVAAGVAYAWWSDTASTPGNEVSTGGVALATSGLPITAGGLAPQIDPELEDPDDAYGSVTYFWVKNDDSIPLMFYGWLSGGAGDWAVLNPYVRIRIWLQGSSTGIPGWWTGYPSGWNDTFQPAPGGPFLSYDGTLEGLWSGQDAGINYLSSRWWDGADWHRTLIGGGEYGVYRAAVWLDSDAPDSTQHKTVSFTINFTGMQEQAWDAAGYDGWEKY